MDTAALAGEILLTSGAETNRVEDTVNRILNTAGLERGEALSLSTGIFAVITDKDNSVITAVRRVKKRDTNINNIYLVNNISRNYCGGVCSLEQAYDELKNIERGKHYTPVLLLLCNIITASRLTEQLSISSDLYAQKKT